MNEEIEKKIKQILIEKLQNNTELIERLAKSLRVWCMSDGAYDFHHGAIQTFPINCIVRYQLSDSPIVEFCYFFDFDELLEVDDNDEIFIPAFIERFNKILSKDLEDDSIRVRYIIDCFGYTLSESDMLYIDDIIETFKTQPLKLKKYNFDE